MFNNDQGRPYMHSNKLRWSWGALSGTPSADWNKHASELPLPALLHRIVHRSYKGLWVDLNGHNPASPPTNELTSLIGVAPLVSPNGRYLFYNLQGYAHRIEAAEQGKSVPEQIQAHPIEVTYDREFYSMQNAPGSPIGPHRRRQGWF